MSRPIGILRRRNADGTVGYQVRWYDAYGKRRSATFASESDARKALRARQVETDKILHGITRAKSDKTLAEAAAEWLKTRSEKRRQDDDSHLRIHILPLLGDKHMADVTPALLEAFVRHLEHKTAARIGQKTSKPLKPWTVKNVLKTLSKLLADVGFRTEIPYRVPDSGYAWIRDAADVGRFLEGCRPDWFHVAAALAVYAGLRKGEIAGLRRDAVDLGRGMLLVERSYDGPTKSKHVRWVPLSPELAAVLRPWLLAHPGELVVSSLTEDTATNVLARRACRRAGIEPVTFHQLRHTAASHLAQRVPLPLVGAVLGHADPKTTARYAHLDTEALARDPRLHLTFAAPEGRVVPFAGNPTGAPRERGPEDDRRTAENK